MQKYLEKNLWLGFCLLVVVVALATLAWVIATGQLFYMDGLLLTFICLLTATIFGGLAAFEKRGVLQALLSRQRAGRQETGPSKKEEESAGKTEEAGKGGEVVVTSAHEHAGGTRLYLGVWGALLGLTAVEVVLAYQHMPVSVMLILLMSLSIVKAGLIMSYFMHLRFERMNLVLAVVPALVLCISLFFMFFPDSFRILKLGIG